CRQEKNLQRRSGSLRPSIAREDPSLLRTGMSARRSGWKGKKESRFLIGLALAPNPSAMAMDDAMDGSQADAMPAKFVAGMETLKWGKQFVGVGHVVPYTIVADKEDGRGLMFDASEFDARVRCFGGEFPGIFQQVLQGGPEQNRIAASGKLFANDDLNAAMRVALPEFAGDLL